jgi:uncharacterized OB-fold protein
MGLDRALHLMAPTFLDESGDDGPRLVGGWSPSSGHHHFPLAPVCPYTGADDVEEVRLSPDGRLWAWTAVTAAPPGYEGPVPYGFGVVELEDEGLRVIGRLTEPDPSKLAAGQPMRLVVERLPGDLDVWAFAPVAEPER